MDLLDIRVIEAKDAIRGRQMLFVETAQVACEAILRGITESFECALEEIVREGGA